jgi:prepilin-type N-terminal cleavage/methylation domain-containing protein
VKTKGFSLIELLILIAILGVLAAIAIPGFSVLLPDYRLRTAARDLQSNMQLAKIGAIKANSNWAIVFDPGVTPGRYYLCSDPGGNGTWEGPGSDDTVEKTIDLARYESGVDYGHGNATFPIGATFDNEITYGSDIVVFRPRATADDGYVYLQNSKNTTTYGVGTRISGVVLLRKWNGAAWE